MLTAEEYARRGKYLSNSEKGVSMKHYDVVISDKADGTRHNSGISYTTRENLVVRRTDGMFNGRATMTRGDAAIILYRMFMKIW